MTEGGPAPKPARGTPQAPPAPDAALVEQLQALVVPQTWLVPAPRGTGRAPGTLVSHVGGRPYLDPHDRDDDGRDPWPECSHCDRPMTFLGELALDGDHHLHIVPARLVAVFLCGLCIREMGPEEPPGRYAVWLHEEVDPRGRVLLPPEDEPFPVRPCRLRPIAAHSLPLGAVLEEMAPELFEALHQAPDGVAEATWHAVMGRHFHGSVVGGYGLPWDETDVPPACPSCDRAEGFLGAIHGADCEPYDGETGAIGPDEVACVYVCPKHPGGVRLSLERLG